MSWIVFIIACVVLLIIRNAIFKKIDEDEYKAATTPGTAEYLRNNFSSVIDLVESSTKYQKEFENSYLIRFVSRNNVDKILLQQSSGKVIVAKIHIDKAEKRWELSKEQVTAMALEEIKLFCEL